jgi:hypothetical protein
MPVSYRYFVVYKVNILPVIPDQPQDIPEIIGIARKEGQLEGYFKILPKAEGFIRGKIEGGSPVLDYFMAEKA